MLANLKIFTLAALALFFFFKGVYWYGHHEGAKDCNAEHAAAALKDYMMREEDGHKKSSVLEKDLAKALNFTQVLERQVDDEISNNAIYRDCIIPEHGVFLANSAIKGKAAR